MAVGTGGFLYPGTELVQEFMNNCRSVPAGPWWKTRPCTDQTRWNLDDQIISQSAAETRQKAWVITHNSHEKFQKHGRSCCNPRGLLPFMLCYQHHLPSARHFLTYYLFVISKQFCYVNLTTLHRWPIPSQEPILWITQTLLNNSHHSSYVRWIVEASKWPSAGEDSESQHTLYGDSSTLIVFSVEFEFLRYLIAYTLAYWYIDSDRTLANAFDWITK